MQDILEVREVSLSKEFAFYYNTLFMKKYIWDKIPITDYYHSEEAFMEDSNLCKQDDKLRRVCTLVAHPRYVYLRKEVDYVKILLELGTDAKFYIKRKEDA